MRAYISRTRIPGLCQKKTVLPDTASPASLDASWRVSTRSWPTEISFKSVSSGKRPQYQPRYDRKSFSVFGVLYLDGPQRVHPDHAGRDLKSRCSEQVQLHGVRLRRSRNEEILCGDPRKSEDGAGPPGSMQSCGWRLTGRLDLLPLLSRVHASA